MYLLVYFWRDIFSRYLLCGNDFVIQIYIESIINPLDWYGYKFNPLPHILSMKVQYNSMDSIDYFWCDNFYELLLCWKGLKIPGFLNSLTREKAWIYLIQAS